MENNNLNVDKMLEDVGYEEKKKKEAEWIMAERLLGELIPQSTSREKFEELKNTYLSGKISWETWKKYWKENPINTETQNKKIINFYNKMDLAKKFIERQPIYYESKNTFYVWNFEKYVWEVKDETHILNLIYLASGANTINSKEKNEILESIRQVGRLNKPKNIRSHWVQFGGKLVDIKTMNEIEATPKFFCSNPIGWKIGESEETPKIDKLINSWVGEKDREKLYELIAFSIVPEYFIHSFFFLYSPPGSGKSTFTNMLIKFLGKENCVSTSIDRINNNVRFETINWHRKLLITLSEVSDINDLRNSGLINQATGEDPIVAEKKGGITFDFVNYGKFLYPTNKLLKVSSDDGFGRRVRVIKFTNRFEKEKNVIDSIPDWEFENLAAKSIRIAKELYEKRKFDEDISISERMQKYQDISKTDVEIFLEKECSLDDFENKMLFDEFYAKFLKFSKTKESKIKVSKQLRKLGYIVKLENWKAYKNSNSISPEFEWKSGMRISGISWKIKQKNL